MTEIDQPAVPPLYISKQSSKAFLKEYMIGPHYLKLDPKQIFNVLEVGCGEEPFTNRIYEGIFTPDMILSVSPSFSPKKQLACKKSTLGWDMPRGELTDAQMQQHIPMMLNRANYMYKHGITVDLLVLHASLPQEIIDWAVQFKSEKCPVLLVTPEAVKKSTGRKKKKMTELGIIVSVVQPVLVKAPSSTPDPSTP